MIPGDTCDGLSQLLDDTVCSMKLGEKCQLEITDCNVICESEQLLKQLNVTALPNGCKVVYTIHLISFERGRDLWELSDQERLEIAKRHKEAGGMLFKLDNTKGAAMCYSKALKYLIPVDPDIQLEVEHLQDYEKEIFSLQSVLMLNLAACQLKFQQYPLVVSNCTRVLEMESDNVKALYRRGQALIMMNDFDRAKEDLTKAKKLESGNKAIDEQLKLLETRQQAHEAKYRDALKSMFGGPPQLH